MRTLSLCLVLLLAAAAAFGEERTTLERSIAVSPSQRIQIEGISGSDVVYRSWTKNEVLIRLSVSISSSDDEYEKRYIRNLKLVDASSSGTLYLRLDELKSEGGAGSFLRNLFSGRFYIEKTIAGEIFLPQSNPLTLDVRYSSLTLDDVKGALEVLGTSNTLQLRKCSAVGRVDNNYGTTLMEHCGGDLHLSGTSSTITISDFDGNIRLSADYSKVIAARISGNAAIADKSGEIGVSSVGGTLSLSADYSTVAVSDVKGAATIRCTSGNIRGRNLDGLEIDANYSTIDLANVRSSSGKPVAVKSQSGELTMQDIGAGLRITNPYSNITLARIKGDVDLETQSSVVDAADITGNWRCRASYATITVRGLTAKEVTMTNKSNPINVSLTSVPSSVDIRSEYGEIKVTMPRGFGGSVEMNCDYGDVETNLPIKVKTMSSASYAAGRVGSGTGSIVLETKSAGITLTQNE